MSRIMSRSLVVVAPPPAPNFSNTWGLPAGGLAGTSCSAIAAAQSSVPADVSWSDCSDMAAPQSSAVMAVSSGIVFSFVGRKHFYYFECILVVEHAIFAFHY